MALLFLDRPIWVIKVYTLTGGLFMPVLAGSLLWLNSKRTGGRTCETDLPRPPTWCWRFCLFGMIAVRQIADLF